MTGRRPSVHRRMVALAVWVSALAVIVVLVGIGLFDAQQYRARATADAASLAGILADNTAAAVAFDDEGAAALTLANLRLQPNVTRGCVYLTNGTLFASYLRDPANPCPVGGAPTSPRRMHVAVERAIRVGQDDVGYIYVESDLSGLAERIGLLTMAGLVLLAVAAGVSFLLAERLSRGISQPIAALAAEARRIGHAGDYTMAEIPAAEDEVGDLVRSFQAMVGRVRDANDGLVREIEQRKIIEAEREVLLERERETSRMKDEFVATVSHELRTPLGSILGWTQVLQATHLDRTMLGKAVQAIARSADAQARVIEDLVDVSRITTGKLKLSLEVLDLRAPVAAAVEIARSDAQARGITIETHMPPLACPVRGDVARLQQVVANLLSNSVKFTDAGGCIAVNVRARGRTCEVQVTDDGVGIEPAVLPHIFDRYRQADSSTARRFQGLGLGLAIVKEVTELHGGTVVAESQGLGKGASFRVQLPRHLVTEVATKNALQLASFSDARLDGVHVLAVDDNPDALDIMATALRAVGAEVRTASSGAEALQEWEHERPDILLCDLAMPVMDGFDVLARIRARDDGEPTPAIAVTAHATAEHRRRSTSAGFAAHVTKPYRVTDLVQAVKEALE